MQCHPELPGYVPVVHHIVLSVASTKTRLDAALLLPVRYGKGPQDNAAARSCIVKSLFSFETRVVRSDSNKKIGDLNPVMVGNECQGQP